MSKIALLVGERIRTLRQIRGLSQEQLALKANLNTSFIGQIERGGKKPTIDTLEKIVNALDVSFEDLFKFEMDNGKEKDMEIIDKVVFQIKGCLPEEQEAIYKGVKAFVELLDKKR